MVMIHDIDGEEVQEFKWYNNKISKKEAQSLFLDYSEKCSCVCDLPIPET